MKIQYFFWLFIFLILSCKKYGDGPGFSVLPKKYRLVGNWKMSKTQSGSSETSLANGDRMKIHKNGSYEILYLPDSSTQSGKWSFSQDKSKLIFTKDKSIAVFTNRIVELRNREIKLSPDLTPNLIYTYVSE